MKLNTLSLKNFKGIKELTIEPQGKDIEISGMNATGKTTVVDAFMWLLFGKDSQNKKDFEIKTLTPDGKPIHGLDHEVTAELACARRVITLKKTYREQWTKKRGAADSTFSGHTIDHHIDGVPAKQKEYDAAIAEIAPEEIFRLLTDPRYFNTALHWSKRREILLEVCGDVPNEEVIETNKDLAGLPAILGDRTIEQHRKVIAEKRKEIQKELDRIPVRIDEVSQRLPDISDLDKKPILNSKGAIERQIKDKNRRLVEIESGGRTAQVRQRIAEITAELQEKKNEAADDGSRDVRRDDISAISREQGKLEDQAERTRDSIGYEELEVLANETELENLRKEWIEADAREFEAPEQDQACPTCGQDLPEDQIEAAAEKARASFNVERATVLQQISERGQALKKRVEDSQKKIAELSKALTLAEKEIEACGTKIKKIEAEIKEAEKTAKTSYQDAPGYADLVKEKAKLEGELEELGQESTAAGEEVMRTIAEDQEKIDRLTAALSEIEHYDSGQARIKELTAQERELATEYEALEKELFATEEFIRTKVRLLEDRINARFEHAKFKLFDTFISGGVEETCETLYQGIPYSTALNNGARINIGLDIIRTLSEHHGLTAPIFIDNAEAINELLEMEAQMIKLTVSEEPKLKVVIAEE